MNACQKREPHLITDGCEPPCGCWGLNPGPLEEHPVFLSSETSLQNEKLIFKKSVFLYVALAGLELKRALPPEYWD